MPTKTKARKKAAPRKQQPKETGKQDTCFIIMPFGDWFDTYYESIYLPAIEATGLTPRRADNLYRPSAIINDIWALTNEAKLILADLSEKNANVFYELGMAHALAKPAILVTESMEDVPFDLRSLRVIVYEKNRPDWGDALREKIQLAIKEVLASPLDAVLPTFIKVKESSTQPSASRVEKEMISLRQDVDRLTREFRFAASGGLETPHLSSSVRHLLESTPISALEGRSVTALQFARRELESGTGKVAVIRELIRRFGLSTDRALSVVGKADRLSAVTEETKPSDSSERVKAADKSDQTPAEG
ncbi:MAG TPA: hypothetical protein VFP64_02905 [Pyrinomonadaceae bacterium]|nr:hypothetical protein [Pyrinomonadaceae bacterium]